MNLPQKFFGALEKGLPCLMATQGADDFPHVGFAWAAARDAHTIWFSVDQDSRALANLKRTGKAALEFLAPGNLIFMAQGECRIVQDDLDAAPLRMSIAEMQVRDVRDQNWAGVQLTPLGFRFEGQGAEVFRAAEKKTLAALTAR